MYLEQDQVIHKFNYNSAVSIIDFVWNSLERLIKRLVPDQTGIILPVPYTHRTN